MRLILALVLSLLALPALADRALVIGQPERGGFFSGSSEDAFPRALEDAGFQVVGAAPASAPLMRAGLAQFLEGSASHDRLIVLLAGPFVQGAGGAWMLAEDAGEAVDLVRVPEVGLSVNAVLQILAQVPGQAVLLLAEKEGPRSLGFGLRPGLGELTLPQGVTVIRGEAREVGSFARRELLVPERSLVAALEKASGLRAEGFLSDAVVFLPKVEDRGPVTEPAGPPVAALEVERAVWEATQAQDSREAYLGYLERYPLGEFAELASERIAAIDAEPNRAERLAEEALTLTRDARRQIQRDLTILDYNPRGIDGIFGPGTRAAVARFQLDSGFPQSTYLDAPQIERLRLQATRRQAELEAEAERRRLEEEAQDRAFWEATGAGRDEAALRTYLKQYPDGLFSEAATQSLAVIEREKRRQAEGQDRVAWDQAELSGTEDSYRRYLNAFPQGVFAGEAQAKIQGFQTQNSSEIQNARRAEARLGLNSITRLLVERRLDALGLQPGKLDGVFDGSTRKAIRRYQGARKLPVTGYLSEATVSRMLSDVGITIRRN